MFLRTVTDPARVAREIRAADPLLAALRAPVTARAPWLTAVLNVTVAHRRWPRPRPVAVAVTEPGRERPAALAVLVLRGAGPRVRATLLGHGLQPVPPGAPPARLPARDDAAAGVLAAGILDLLGSSRRPWTLRLAGLPLGDPTLRALGRLRPDGAFANERSWALLDDLDERGPVRRTRDPRELERWLPALLAHAPGPRAGELVRAAARLHAAIGQLELAVVARGDRLHAALLTLDDGRERRPWWGIAGSGALPTRMGAPLVGFTVSGGPWPPGGLSRRGGGR